MRKLRTELVKLRVPENGMNDKRMYR